MLGNVNNLTRLSIFGTGSAKAVQWFKQSKAVERLERFERIFVDA
jgi:hypothetical protein